MPESLRTYDLADFASPTKECDLIMKGGVTSGVVYPYAVLELAKVYRFRSIGGTSAGAIAGAFAAAAEYARTVRGDPAGFLRLQRRCESLPDILGSLFQPTPRYASLMRYLLRSQAGKGAGRWFWNLPRTFWASSGLGLAGGAVVLYVLQGGVAGALLGGVVGLTAILALRLIGLIRSLPTNGFGMCPGLQQGGHDTPALTDWLHAAIQDIAFGDPAHPRPLTFGDLAGADGGPAITLKMITTNLSMHRPHTLPRLGILAGFSLADWAALFPTPVMTYLDGATLPMARLPSLRGFPAEDALPVVVGVRMSLSFPFLFSAIPMVVRDVQAAMLARKTGGDGTVQARRIWFTDGGLSSNFPIHMFDSILPSRPTFALSLDPLPLGAREDGERVFIPKSAGDGIGVPSYAVNTMGDFALGILGSAKDWQDQLLAGMPGQRERIAKVFLSPDEGGLNLTMPKERSHALMKYGQEVGQRFADGALDFDEHRWRRSLVAYEQLEQTVGAIDAVWVKGGFGGWLKSYMAAPKSYTRVTKTDRALLHRRLGELAGLWAGFQPLIKNTQRKFPRPSARLRSGPDI